MSGLYDEQYAAVIALTTALAKVKFFPCLEDGSVGSHAVCQVPQERLPGLSNGRE